MTTEIRVSGMACSSCAATLERSLKTILGVKTVLVNLRNETAIVEGSADINALLVTIEDKGYGASVTNR